MTQDSETTRWSLIEGAAAGRSLDRTEFARRYASVIRAYFTARWRRSGFPGEVEDAVQDVFVDCFREDGALVRVDPSRPGGFRAFLYGVVRNVARRIEEKRFRRRELNLHSGFEGQSADEPLDEVFDRAWAKAVMRQAAALQSERGRAEGGGALRRVELLRLRFTQGHTMKQIAETWGMDRRRAQYEYDKARREFEAALHEVLGRHHPAGAVPEERARLLRHYF